MDCVQPNKMHSLTRFSSVNFERFLGQCPAPLSAPDDILDADYSPLLRWHPTTPIDSETAGFTCVYNVWWWWRRLLSGAESVGARDVGLILNTSSRHTSVWIRRRILSGTNSRSVEYSAAFQPKIMGGWSVLAFFAMIIGWLGGRVVRTSDSRLAVEGSPPGHDTAWIFISETGDRLWRLNSLHNCNHHPGQLSLAPLRGR